MFIIVFGHYFGEPYNQFTQPIYPKQLGVAFFVFVMGWGLAKEIRPHWQVVYNRLFPMYFWGLAITLFISLLSLIINNSLKLTNFLPFVGGANVIANHFPSNPTTWFIGTYLHILVLWAWLLRRISISIPLLIIVFIFEWLVRSILINEGHLYNAYMLTSNWLSILVLGMYLSQKTDKPKNNSLTLAIGLLWLTFLGSWAWLMNTYVSFAHSFPFKTLIAEHGILSSMGASLAISAAYITNTLFAIALFQRIKAYNLVRFFSRNTIIVFVGHMPLYDVAEPVAKIFVQSGWGKRAIIIFIMFVGLSILSEYLHKIIDLKKLKLALWSTIKSAL